jgi:Protease inhibitor Inh
MGSKTVTASLIGAALALAATAAGAQDMNAMARDQVGTPLAVSDAAAQGWTLETAGHTVCKVRLGAQAIGKGVYHADVPADCAQTLPAGVAGWKPVTDGAALVDGQGQVLIDFNRWSNSLLVSHQSSGVDVQLRRGG